jgi:hypothetical protein
MGPLVLVLLLASPCAAQDWVDITEKVIIAATAKREAPLTFDQAQARKHSMFDTSCGEDVDVEQATGFAAAFPDMGKDWNQSWVPDCWAYAGCLGIEYARMSRDGAPAPAEQRCDPVLTGAAVKLGLEGKLYDTIAKDGSRSSFMSSDSFANFPARLKVSTFGRHPGLEEMCRRNGCYCARATDHDLAPYDMLASYEKAKLIVENNLRKTWIRKNRVMLGEKLFAEANAPGDSLFDDQGATTRRIADELTAAGLPGIIRSSLDDATVSQLWALQRYGAAFDNKLYARTILAQSCMPVPLPAIKVVSAPAAIGDDQRAKIMTEPMSAAPAMRGLFNWINGKLGAHKPVMIGFCSSLLDYKDEKNPQNGDYVGTPEPPKPPPPAKPFGPGLANSAVPGGGKGCGNHNVAIIGRKMIGGVCHYGIRNSWGDWHGPNPEVKTGAPGTQWIPAYLLMQNTFDAGTFE